MFTVSNNANISLAWLISKHGVVHNESFTIIIYVTTPIHTQTHTYTHTHMYTHMRTHTHVHTYTHTNLFRGSLLHNTEDSSDITQLAGGFDKVQSTDGNITYQ